MYFIQITAKISIIGNLYFDIYDKSNNSYCSYAEHHICAGDARGDVGSCKGDSGGPLIYYNSRADPPFYLLIGVLHGSSDQCEDERTDAPGIFARVNHPEIFDFIRKAKADLELCQELKDCFCELANLSCS